MNAATLGFGLSWLAKTSAIEKSVKQAHDSFWEGLTRGDADAVAIVLVAVVVLGGCLAAYYFRNRG